MAQPRPTNDFRILTAAESAVLLTNLLNSAGVLGFRLTPPQPNSGAAYFTLSDGSKGSLLASEGTNTKGADDYVADTIGRLTKLCSGQFLSGKEPIASTDGSVGRKIVATCREPDGVTSFESTVIRKRNGFLMELTLSRLYLLDQRIPNVTLSLPSIRLGADPGGQIACSSE